MNSRVWIRAHLHTKTHKELCLVAETQVSWAGNSLGGRRCYPQWVTAQYACESAKCRQSRHNLLAQLIDNYRVYNCHACYYLLLPIDSLQLERMLIRSQRQIERGLLLRELQFLLGFVCLPVCQFVVCYLFICRLHEDDKQSTLIAIDFKLPAYCKIHICLVRAPSPSFLRPCTDAMPEVHAISMEIQHSLLFIRGEKSRGRERGREKEESLSSALDCPR